MLTRQTTHQRRRKTPYVEYLKTNNPSTMTQSSISPELFEVSTFLSDAGMSIVAHRDAATMEHPGFIVFEYEVFTKNIFNLLDIDLREELVDDEYVLIYYFGTTTELNELFSRISSLFKLNA